MSMDKKKSKVKRRAFLKAVAAGSITNATDRSDSFMKSTTKSRSQQEVTWNRKVSVRWEADVAVIGGGIASVSAACAAAETGAKVVLVERFAVCGGVLTSGGVASFCGRMDGNGRTFDEIVADLKKWDSIGHPRAAIFDHEILAVVLQELTLRRGVKLLLHTRFTDVLITDGKISACILTGFSGPEAIGAKQFIDCTGGGDVARMAGCEVMIAKEPLPMSMMGQAAGIAAAMATAKDCNVRDLKLSDIQKVIEQRGGKLKV